MKSIIKIVTVGAVFFFIGCNKDRFAELNSNPSTVTSADVRFQTTQSIKNMYNEDYLPWFYNNFRYIFPWAQVTTSGLGNAETFVEVGAIYDFWRNYNDLLPNIIDLRKNIDAKSTEEQKTLAAIRAITYPIMIQPSMVLSDNVGSIVYKEAGIGLLTTPPTLTAAYDNQQVLFDTWLEELNKAITDLTANVPGTIQLGNQDLIYKGDYGKWAKFCNLLKLRIAARLINKDRAKALQIAQEVANSPAGYMDNLTEDFVYNRGVKYYSTGNGTQPGTGARNLINFLVNNKDPRVRFIYQKNDFNAEVIQQFIDQKKPLPSYVAQYVNVDGSGNFAGWKSLGEPWVRYFGVPVSPHETLLSANDDYFKQNTRNKIDVGNASKTFRSTSSYSEYITRTSMNFTYPTKVGGRLIEQKDITAGYNVVLGSSAETNLYLAEFKLLGANLPKSAQEYLNRGVELSVKRMDAIASNNKLPYYDSDPVYSGTEATQASIKLKDGEITQLLTQPAYNLSSNALEKVYIQQLINFAQTPFDMWTLIRRAGVFINNSTVLPREKFFVTQGGAELTVPRRFPIATPTKANKNYENALKALQEQGFTSGTNIPATLSTERIWFDKENPNYGEGPK
ncbi:SusD/RagB family nutrient-binding outer membrane lipoprotein [Niabella aquatica]